MKVVLLFLLFLILPLCRGTEWYVSEDTGFDSFNGTTPSSAFASLSKAVSVADNGDVIYVFNGIYEGENNRNLVITKQLSFVGESEAGTIVDLNGRSNFAWMNATAMLFANFTWRGSVCDEEQTNCLFYVEGTQSKFQNCTFTGNKVQNDEVALVELSLEGVLSQTGGFYQCSFIDNSGSGQLLHLHGGSLTTMNETLFDGNQCDLGTLIVAGTAEVLLSECNFLDNRANGNSSLGGALLLQDRSVVRCQGCDFSGNRASTYGGAIAVQGGLLELRDSTFSTNLAAFGGAVAILVDSSTEPHQIDACRLHGNTAFRLVDENGGYGGALYFESTNVELTNCTISDNTAALSGGALALLRLSSTHATSGHAFPLIAQDSQFLFNQANSQGGAVFLQSAEAASLDNKSPLIFERCEFQHNTANRGDAFWSSNSNEGAVRAEVAFTGTCGFSEIEIENTELVFLGCSEVQIEELSLFGSDECSVVSSSDLKFINVLDWNAPATFVYNGTGIHGSFINEGTMTVASSNKRLFNSFSLTNEGSITFLPGSAVRRVFFQAPLIYNDETGSITVQGFNTISGTFTNYGTVIATAASVTFDVSIIANVGAFVLMPTSQLQVPVQTGGFAVDIVGTIQFDGSVTVSWPQNSAAEDEAEYTVLRYTSRIKTFSSVHGTGGFNSKKQKVHGIYNSKSFDVSVGQRNSSNGPDLGAGAIAGITIVAFGVLCLAAIGMWWWWREKQRRRRRRRRKDPLLRTSRHDTSHPFNADEPDDFLVDDDNIVDDLDPHSHSSSTFGTF